MDAESSNLHYHRSAEDDGMFPFDPCFVCLKEEWGLS